MKEPCRLYSSERQDGSLGTDVQKSQKQCILGREGSQTSQRRREENHESQHHRTGSSSSSSGSSRRPGDKSPRDAVTHGRPELLTHQSEPQMTARGSLKSLQAVRSESDMEPAGRLFADVRRGAPDQSLRGEYIKQHLTSIQPSFSFQPFSFSKLNANHGSKI